MKLEKEPRGDQGQAADDFNVPPSLHQAVDQQRSNSFLPSKEALDFMLRSTEPEALGLLLKMHQQYVKHLQTLYPSGSSSNSAPPYVPFIKYTYNVLNILYQSNQNINVHRAQDSGKIEDINRIENLVLHLDLQKSASNYHENQTQGNSNEAPYIYTAQILQVLLVAYEDYQEEYLGHDILRPSTFTLQDSKKNPSTEQTDERHQSPQKKNDKGQEQGIRSETLGSDPLGVEKDIITDTTKGQATQDHPKSEEKSDNVQTSNTTQPVEPRNKKRVHHWLPLGASMAAGALLGAGFAWWQEACWGSMSVGLTIGLCAIAGAAIGALLFFLGRVINQASQRAHSLR